MIHDVAIIGAGIAGASLAAALPDAMRVLILETEDHPGYHATGRSAAFWDETYGGTGIQPLTSASGPMLADPSAEMGGVSFLGPRGALILAWDDEQSVLDAMATDFADSPVRLESMAPDALAARVPGLREGWSRALFQPGCADIDVARLHAAFLTKARRQGATLLTRAPLLAARRVEGVWHVMAGGETHRAALLINAAGAWADPVAALAGITPIGITPHRRTIVQLRVSPKAPADLPLVIHAGGQFYFKPEPGGRLWISPHDETPDQPGDVAADELDVALAIDRLQAVVDWRVEAVERKWAGLRSFAPDRLPAYGFDPDVPGFFWCAGQGGFGIQTAPAAARMAADWITGAPSDPSLNRALYDVARLHR